MKKIITLALTTFVATQLRAQTPFLASDSLTINKVSATVLVHGDMWWNGDATGFYATKAFFPRGTGLSIGGFGNAVWMSGYDGGGHLHVAAQTYRQDGNDYWPGPLSSGSIPVPYATSRDWAKVWKVNRTDIGAFKAMSGHTITNTPDMILTWPGKGNSYAKGNLNAALDVTNDMAPFADLNGNGVYEPLLGEYPAIKGDQTLWWVFNDNGANHGQSNGLPLGVEVKAMSYGYNRGTLIDNVAYYDYEITNKSINNYSNFRFALHKNMDLGYYADDYIGFDSTFRLAVQYNGTFDDGLTAGNPSGTYGTSMPVTGVTIVYQPGDMMGAYGAAGSYTIFNGDFSVIGNPTAPQEYDNYMRGKRRDGMPFTRDTGSIAFGTGPITNYMYDGDPGIPGQWTECGSGNATGDQSSVLSTLSFPLAAGETKHVVLALVVTDTSTNNHCGSTALTFTGIKTVADTAWRTYYYGTTEVAQPTVRGGVSVYPNPANGVVNVSFASAMPKTLQLYNAMGQVVPVQWSTKGKEATANVRELPVGMYYIRYMDNDIAGGIPFVKQ
jgi:hypothetical protein